MKKRNLVLALAITTTLLTACRSSVSKEAYESLEARANKAESEMSNLKESFEELNSSLEESKESDAHDTKTADFTKHEAVDINDLPDFLKNNKEAKDKMFMLANVVFLKADIGIKDSEFLYFENYEKVESDNERQNSGFRIDLVYKTRLRNVSFVLYYFDYLEEWTFVGIKNYDNLHWYYINSGMNIDVPLYDYETDEIK